VTQTPWRDLRVRAASAVVLAGFAVGVMWLGGVAWAVSIVGLGALMAVEWADMCGHGAVRRLSGLLYVGPAVVSLIWLRAGAHGFGRLVFLAAIVWAGDIGAYLVGRLVGGPRLAPRISPGKTWSGALGGTACAVLAGLAAAPVHTQAVGLVALVLSLAAQLGDLLESALKRYFGVKDSGTIIPGHGGLLDRLDGVLTAAPAAVLLSLAASP
jgi:phosphatidate cytidylyltransferase